MPDTQVAPDTRSISAKSRRSSVSAIPRPVSGTSRRATPTVSRAGKRDSPAAGPTLDLYPRRKSWHTKDSLAPTSYRKPQIQLSQLPEYSLPYQQRAQQDLSGTRQQLHIRNLSTHSLNVRDTDTGLHQLKQASSANALPKSKTISSFRSPPRDTTPGRRLLQPIGPPLPRTQTLGNISCFNPVNHSPSPRKPQPISLSPPQQHHNNVSQLNIADALGESRMTKEEVDLMKQVQREATANRARLRNAHQQYKPSPYAASEGSVASRDIPILNPSMNDAANIQHPEGSKRRSSSGRLLFINSTLANKNWQQSEPSTATSVVSIGSVTSSEPSQKEENDPRNVYVAEPKAYWTGRYISLCDRLRMAELKRPPPSPSETNEKQIDRLFESSEKVRMNSALEELRGHCKTSEALISFEAFEGSLLKSMGISRQSLHRAGAVAYGTKVADRGLTASRTMPLAMAVSHTPVTLSSSMSRISSVNGEPAMTDASRTCYGEGNLTKSKTTGNLSSLIPIIPKRRHVIITGPASKQNSVQQISHRRQSSYFEGSPETRTKALKEREQRAARRAAEAHWRSTSQALSPDGPSSRPPSGKVLEPGEMSQPQLVSYSSSIKGSDELSYSLSATALESGHGRPPPVPTNVAPSRVELVNMASGGKEKVIKSRHKPERQFSGDRVKTFLEAGVREVRKMGRRVSGMSWPGSGEY